MYLYLFYSNLLAAKTFQFNTTFKKINAAYFNGFFFFYIQIQASVYDWRLFEYPSRYDGDVCSIPPKFYMLD